MASRDSHLSTDKHGVDPKGAVGQHHRLARGDNVSGESNPNGAGPDTTKKVANQPKNY